MRIEQEKAKFTPLTLVLETEDEVMTICGALHLMKVESILDSWKTYGYVGKNEDLSRIWNMLDDWVDENIQMRENTDAEAAE